jgi:hypothetical protein
MRSETIFKGISTAEGFAPALSEDFSSLLHRSQATLLLLQAHRMHRRV